MPDIRNIVGCILAGGLSRRMGGRDKPLIPLGDRPMIARVSERLSPQVSCLIVNANGDPLRYCEPWSAGGSGSHRGICRPSGRRLRRPCLVRRKPSGGLASGDRGGRHALLPHGSGSKAGAKSRCRYHRPRSLGRTPPSRLRSVANHPSGGSRPMDEGNRSLQGHVMGQAS